MRYDKLVSNCTALVIVTLKCEANSFSSVIHCMLIHSINTLDSLQSSGPRMPLPGGRLEGGGSESMFKATCR